MTIESTFVSHFRRSFRVTEIDLHTLSHALTHKHDAHAVL